MSLAPGTRLGPYEILALIGAGGMGEVYKGRDTRLNRFVAIKVAHSRFSERFEREARAVAALNHPHICQLYDIGSSPEAPGYLVMEFVEGAPLKGPLPIEKAVEYAGQILDALDEAHKKNIAHRDLKPANILITKSGIKLLDFGLAKQTAPLKETDPTRSLTEQGQILGTLQYMSPEQLQGKEVDARSDLFSFGCVLYEMLNGRRAFEGESAASVIAAILEREPASRQIARPLERIVRRSLAKDPDQRFQTARDLKAALVWAMDQPVAVAATASSRSRVSIAVIVVLVVALAGVSWIAWRATRPVDHPLTRLNVDLGPEVLAGLNTTVGISPDGRRLVYPARGPDGKQQLATRLLDQTEPTFLPGTEGGFDPFFSPDSQWIGFFAGGFLKKISVQGGGPVALWPASSPCGASWGEDGNIVVALGQVSPLSLVRDTGGASKPLTKLAAGEDTHRWPQILTGAQAVIFTASPYNFGQEDANIEAVSLKTGEVKILARGSYGRYLPSGHLTYVHQGVLYGVELDPAKLEVRGTPIPILDDVAANPSGGGGQFNFSATGTFVYSGGEGRGTAWQVAWLDSSGKTQPLMATPGAYTQLRFSPDGHKLAFMSASDIFTYDLDRGGTTRLTFTGKAQLPLWAPDGKHILFRGGGTSLFWIPGDRADEPQRLLERHSALIPWSFSPDGHWLAYNEPSPETRQDIWTLPLDLTDPAHPKAGTPEPFLHTAADDYIPKFSPEGRWIAYRSNVSGSDEIWVRPFRGSGGPTQISTGGGLYAFWSDNGHELFYETVDHTIKVVDYKVNGDLFEIVGKPRPWSDKQLFYPGTANLDLHRDGKRFAVLMLPETAPGEKGSVHVTMLENFFDELKRRIPAGGK